eukprot:TRINITY_DN92893_c0_g1_i1.p1 TRINITY_DN92893_c0_g1~~TRINITY_DN92893_c0_g1_i1.p1  ORF type:complete len:401 (-),score=29.80 TRINITY_DN92893_c0_g1_i1:134-1336(-)
MERSPEFGSRQLPAPPVAADDAGQRFACACFNLRDVIARVGPPPLSWGASDPSDSRFYKSSSLGEECSRDRHDGEQALEDSPQDQWQRCSERPAADAVADQRVRRVGHPTRETMSPPVPGVRTWPPGGSIPSRLEQLVEYQQGLLSEGALLARTGSSLFNSPSAPRRLADAERAAWPEEPLVCNDGAAAWVDDTAGTVVTVAEQGGVNQALAYSGRGPDSDTTFGVASTVDERYRADAAVWPVQSGSSSSSSGGYLRTYDSSIRHAEVGVQQHARQADRRDWARSVQAGSNHEGQPRPTEDAAEGQVALCQSGICTPCPFAVNSDCADPQRCRYCHLCVRSMQSLHDSGACRPCIFHVKVQGCNSGDSCHFCHSEHSSRVRHKRHLRRGRLSVLAEGGGS